MSTAMRWAYGAADQIIDPHTAIALHAARTAVSARCASRDIGDRASCKIPQTQLKMHGRAPRTARARVAMFDREERFDVLPGEYDAVRDMCWRAPRVEHGTGFRHPHQRTAQRFTLIDSGTDANMNPMATAASSAPNRKQCGLRHRRMACRREFVPGSDDDGGGRWYIISPSNGRMAIVVE